LRTENRKAQRSVSYEYPKIKAGSGEAQSVFKRERGEPGSGYSSRSMVKKGEGKEIWGKERTLMTIARTLGIWKTAGKCARNQEERRNEKS